METAKKRTETISETTTLLILKKTVSNMQPDWCEKCAAEVFWIAPTEISLLGVSRLPDSKEIHRNGEQICLRSLIKEVKEAKMEKI